MLKLNLEKLVKVAVAGEVASPLQWPGYTVSHEGQPSVLPSVGGITYNVKIGDLVAGWIGDHIEPGVSTYNKEGKEGRLAKENIGYNILACIGNKAKLTSGQAKGATGVVTGMHGGVEHVLIDFSDKVLAKIAYGDKVQITAFGLGLAIVNLPGVKLFNLDPALLQKINPSIVKGKIKMPVKVKIPPYLMGSGLGYGPTSAGDYDITMADAKTNQKLGLDKLRFGDLVAIEDSDNFYGRTYRPGAMSIGVVVHSDCVLAGHGPGVTTIMTSRGGEIEPVINKDANIGQYLKIGRWRKN
ncbi:DUF4438 domain-containing protein [Patescibacteria group bacterium]|nr:DUF4438 domain-containing protein [Patescibacteria group bacterium]